MAVAIETLVKQLEGSGVMTSAALKPLIPPFASPRDSEEFVNELLRRRHITQYQAQRIQEGRVDSLLLGNYILLKELGAGGMGVVYQARHRRMDRVVALKVLPDHQAQDPKAVARFEREARAAAKLSHPHIVTAFDADQAEGVHFLVMEFIEGRDLSSWVKQDGPYSPLQAVQYALQAARGLEYAHRQGVVHRDIKPSNLLLDSSGKVKILDLGLARIELKETDFTRDELTSVDECMGTFDYMAPEQAVSAKHADHRADIYSLGCTLFYLMIGRPIYAGDSLVSKLFAHRDQPAPHLREFIPGLPAELDALYQRMVAKDVAARPQSMREVVSQLEKFEQRLLPSLRADLAQLEETVDRAPLALRQPAAPQPAPRRRAVRSWPALAGTALLVLGLLAGVILQLPTPDGTLVVEADQPGTVIEVLDPQGKVEVRRAGGSGVIKIEVDPGKHRLKVSKDGFQFFAKDFELPAGGMETIKAKLIPAPIATLLPQPVTPGPAPAAIPPSKLAPAAVAPAPVAVAPAVSPARVSGNVDRDVATWVLSRSGSVEIAQDPPEAAPPSPVVRLEQLPSGNFHLRAIDFRKCDPLQTADLGQLSQLTRLVGLNFAANIHTDEDLALIGKVATLESLSLSGGLSLSDQGIAELAALRRLKSLQLGGRVLNAGDAELLAALPNLTSLAAYGVENDAALQRLCDAPALTSLELGAASKISNEGLRSLGQSPKLTHIVLTALFADDAGLAHLTGLKELTGLTLDGGNFTEGGVAALRAALPKCKSLRIAPSLVAPK